MDSVIEQTSSNDKYPKSTGSNRVPKPIGFHALTNAPYYGGGVQDKKDIDSYRNFQSSNTSYGNIENSQKSSVGTYYGGESKAKLQEKYKQLAEQKILISEKHWQQKMIFFLSFVVNFALNYDLDVCVRIQVSITGDNSLPRVQFIRLTCAIAVILLGVTFEQLSDLQSRRVIFGLIISFTIMKLFYEIDTYQNPLSRIESEQNLYIKNLSKFVQALLLAIHKVLQVA